MIAVIDNYDSFTWNLVQHLGTLGAPVEVLRNDVLTAGELAERPLAGLVISSGAGQPREAGISRAAILRLAGRLPILGVGLGHLAVGEAHGARVTRAARPVHGRTSPILHRGRGLFAGLDNPFEGMRYHALVLERESLPACLELVAWTPDGEVMGLRHRDHETWGVQFHPDSILTRQGLRLIENFLALCRQQRSAR